MGIVNRQAMVSAGASLVPIPGLDLMVDVSVVVKMFDSINATFGLTPDQIARLKTSERVAVLHTIHWMGATFVGKIITSEMIMGLLRTMAVKMTGKQISRWVPVAGQLTAATLGFAMVKYLGHQHIADCEKVSREILKTLSYTADNSQ